MMAATVASIYRHPVKSMGEEALEQVMLETGRHVPWDRVWAIAHGDSAFDPARPAWTGARSFVTQTRVPALAQIRCAFDESSGTLRLDHPDRPPLEILPDTAEGAAALGAWIVPLARDFRRGPYRLARLPDAALTDFPHTHLLVCSTATLAALEDVAGQRLEHIRFRANLWLDGLEPWEEIGLGGRELRVGAARLTLTERCERCNATAANPVTGTRDVIVPPLIRRHTGHMDFGIYARVAEGGRIALGDRATLA